MYFLNLLLNWRFAFDWSDSYILIIIFAFVLIVFFGVRIRGKQDKKFVESLFQFAKAQNLSFSEGVSQGTAKFVADFGVGSLFEVGGLVRNVFWAEYNYVLKFRAFEYYYSVPSRSGTTTLQFSVAQLDLPIYLPDVQVRQEDVFSRIGTAFGKQDIEVGEKEFDRMFRVRGKDEEAIRSFLNEDVRKWLMQDDNRGFEVMGYRVMIFKGGEMNAQFVAESRNSLLSFWDLLPKELKEGVS